MHLLNLLRPLFKNTYWLPMLVILITACEGSPPAFIDRQLIDEQLLTADSFSVELVADGITRQLTTNSSTNVRQLIDEAGVELRETDEISPPLFTPLTGWAFHPSCAGHRKHRANRAKRAV